MYEPTHAHVVSHISRKDKSKSLRDFIACSLKHKDILAHGWSKNMVDVCGAISAHTPSDHCPMYLTLDWSRIMHYSWSKPGRKGLERRSTGLCRKGWSPSAEESELLNNALRLKIAGQRSLDGDKET